MLFGEQGCGGTGTVFVTPRDLSGENGILSVKRQKHRDLQLGNASIL